MDDNEETFLEKRQFQLGIEMETTKNEISKTLGFTSALPHSRVKLMYDMCRFKKAFEPEEVSPWCAAFSTENFKVRWGASAEKGRGGILRGSFCGFKLSLETTQSSPCQPL